MAREQRESLLGLIRTLQSRGAIVAIILMPEHSELRKRVPAVGLDQLMASLHSLGANEPTMLDWRDKMDDRVFNDIVHVDQIGRAKFSEMLADTISTLMPKSHPPLGLANTVEKH
jgi:hypothetical protein